MNSIKIKMKIADLKENPANYRTHSEKQLNELVRSLNMFGQIRPIIVDENNIILVGHALKRAFEIKGDIEADVIKYDNISNDLKTKLLIADNRIQYLGGENLELLYNLIRECEYTDIPGYDEDILQSMADVPFETIVETEISKNEKMNETQVEEIIHENIEKYEEQEKGKTTCPKCGFEF